MTEKTIANILGKFAQSKNPFEDSLNIIEKIMTPNALKKGFNDTEYKTFLSAKSDMLAFVFFKDKKPYSIDVFSENADWGIHAINHGINRDQPKIFITDYKPSKLSEKSKAITYGSLLL